MTAFHNMMLFSPGAPETPAGGSSCSLLKSLISRLLAAVDMMGKGRWRLLEAFETWNEKENVDSFDAQIV